MLKVINYFFSRCKYSFMENNSISTAITKSLLLCHPNFQVKIPFANWDRTEKSDHTTRFGPSSAVWTLPYFFNCLFFAFFEMFTHTMWISRIENHFFSRKATDFHVEKKTGSLMRKRKAFLRGREATRK